MALAIAAREMTLPKDPEEVKARKESYADILKDMWDTCYNCEVYDWKCDMKNLKKCMGCKMVVYCSRICQLEHWNKIHRKQCKYLAGTKVHRDRVHTEDNCPKCKLMKSKDKKSKEKEFRNIKSGLYPCLLEAQHSTQCTVIIWSTHPYEQIQSSSLAFVVVEKQHFM